MCNNNIETVGTTTRKYSNGQNYFNVVIYIVRAEDKHNGWNNYLKFII